MCAIMEAQFLNFNTQKLGFYLIVRSAFMSFCCVRTQEILRIVYKYERLAGHEPCNLRSCTICPV